MSERSVSRCLLAVGVLAALCPTAARAQSIDYTTLEQVFGEPITASVTGKPQRASDVPGDLTIITQDNIRRSGANNIPDILQFVPGIDVRHYGLGDVEVAIRGYNNPLNPRLLVLVDGRQIYADDNGRVAWYALPVQLAEIRQIEIIKGPASALFGFNAASGVINIITFDPLLDKVNSATIEGGTPSYGEVNAVGTAHFSDTAGVRLSAGGWEAREFGGETTLTGEPPPRYGSVNLDAHWQVTPNILLRASAGATDARASQDQVGNVFGQTDNRVRYVRLGAVADTRIGTIDFDIYRNMAVYSYDGNHGFLNDTLVTKLSDLLKVDATNTVRVGLEYRSNRASGAGEFGGAIEYDLYSVNGLWDWQITPRVDLANAARLDYLVLGYSGTLLPIAGRTQATYNKTNITQPSFNSGLVIKVSDLDTVRLTAARGLQIPSLIDFAFQLAAPGFLILGSPTVKPTAVWNAELAYDRSVASLGATLTTGVFFQRNTNLVAEPGESPFSFAAGQLVNVTTNVGSSNEIGYELSVKGKTAGGFRWNAGYSFASITQDITSADISNGAPTARYDDGTPQHSVDAGAGYTTGPWELDAAAKWQSKYADEELVGHGFQAVYMHDEFTLNGRAAYQVTQNVTVAAVGQQYEISRIFKPTGTLTERRFIASVTVHF